MKTDSHIIDEKDQTKTKFQRLGLYLDDSNLSEIKSSLVEYTKNWNHLSFGLILKQVISLHTKWTEDDKMIVDDEDNKEKKKKKKSKQQIILDKKNIPEEFHNDSELLKYWLQRYRLFSKFDEGIVLDRGNRIYLFDELFFFSFNRGMV
jgi:trimethylguanosine synthase